MSHYLRPYAQRQGASMVLMALAPYLPGLFVTVPLAMKLWLVGGVACVWNVGR